MRPANTTKPMPPFSNNRAETVASLGEERLIARIRRWLGDVSPPAPFGIGDDCAVLPPPKPLPPHKPRASHPSHPSHSSRSSHPSHPAQHAQALTVDPVIYGRHFDDTVPPRAVGAKLLKRNLSDLAAMGAAPVAAVLALTLDPRARIAWVEQFYRGLAACARAHRLRIVGGDIAQADGALAASLTLLGRATTTRMLLRAGARVGDHIYTTGTLGGSILGKHWRFTPRLAEGAWLAARPEVRAMMDLSDGIAKDIRALTPPAARAELAAAAIPVSRAALRLAKTAPRKNDKKRPDPFCAPPFCAPRASAAASSVQSPESGVRSPGAPRASAAASSVQSPESGVRSPASPTPTRAACAALAHALSDGEDYELLFAVAARADLAALEKNWRARFPKTPLSRIGRFVPLRAPREPGSIDLAAYHGYEHLRVPR